MPIISSFYPRPRKGHFSICWFIRLKTVWRSFANLYCTPARCSRTPPETVEAVVVELESGPRRFPYPGSYYWSRNAQGAYCVTSALMALEAWGHRRIDDGEDVDWS